MNNPRNLWAWIILILMLAVAILYPWISPYPADDFSSQVLLHPSSSHWLGTDEMGHDIFSMLLAGFRVSMLIALSAAVLSTLLGSVLALLGAYYRGWLETLIKRLSEFFLIIPEIVVLLFYAAIAQPQVYNSILAISLFSWSKVTRILRIRALVAIQNEKVEYTMLLKGALWDILIKMWGELSPAISSLFVLQVSKALVYESTLAFFGIGDPLAISWGRIIRMAIDYGNLFSSGAYLWYLLPPLFCISLLVVSLSALALESEY